MNNTAPNTANKNTVDYKAIRAALYEAQSSCEIDILKEKGKDITIYDAEGGRGLTYHLTAPTKTWLKSKIKILTHAKPDATILLDNMIDLLLHIDPMMLVTLGKVYIMHGSDDIDELMKDAECTHRHDIPEIITDDNFIGVHWFDKQSIVINVKTIKDAVKESQDETPDVYINEGREIAIGIYTTLTHEIRHLGLSNPYLNEDDYPLSEESEDAVERWGIEEFEKWYY